MMTPLWSDERIAEWTSTHDQDGWVEDVYGIGVRESVIPTAEVTAMLRQMRDEYEAKLAQGDEAGRSR